LCDRLFVVWCGSGCSVPLAVVQRAQRQAFGMGMIYIALFGLGSIGGMAALSVAIMLPLRHSAKRYAGMHQYLQLGIGAATTLLGISMMIDIGSSGGLLG